VTVGASDCDRKEGGLRNLRQGSKVNETEKTGVEYKCTNVI